MKELVVPARSLKTEDFSPFGQAIGRQIPPGTSSGPGWECWCDIATLTEANMRLGQVLTQPANAPITVMERHPDEELLLPVTGTLLQALAKPGAMDNPAQEPDANEVMVFRIEPGEAIIIAPGVWHAAAIGLAHESLYFFAAVPHAPEPGREASPWVNFKGREAIWVQA